MLELLKYTLPALVVFATAYFLIKAMLVKEEKKMKLEVFLNNQKAITPIRLQAYERLIILLERIHPESLVVRENQPDMTNQQLHQVLLGMIRGEFEHNLSQQLYVTPQAWMLIKNAKESLVQLVNAEALQLVPSDSSINLSKAIIEAYMQDKKSAHAEAIAFLKEEVQSLF